MRVGVLALQGAYAAHATILKALGAEVVEVRHAKDLADLAALVLPGGESTTMTQLAEERGILTRIRTRSGEGMALLGTCAGAILLAREVEGNPGMGLALIDMTIRRNAFGEQRESFTTSPPTAAHHRLFIRAPRLTSIGPGVEVLDRLENTDEPIAVRQGNRFAATYHPELAPDPWLHAELLRSITPRNHA